MFKKGDIVECVGVSISCRKDEEDYASGKRKSPLVVGAHYEVTSYKEESYGKFVGVFGGGAYVNGTYAEQFKLVKNNNAINMKITNLVKKILDNDTRKLVEAGFINGDLALTDEGVNELLAILFLEKKNELVKVAEEKNAETKK